jgi:translation initiation factor IF-3
MKSNKMKLFGLMAISLMLNAQAANAQDVKNQPVNGIEAAGQNGVLDPQNDPEFLKQQEEARKAEAQAQKEAKKKEKEMKKKEKEAKQREKEAKKREKEAKKREKEAKKRQKEIEVKELRLSPNIDDNDLNTKANQAKKFLSKGDKLKVSLRFRGREMAHVGSNSQVLDKFIELVADVGVIEKAPKLEGRNMSVTIAPKKN